MMIFRPEASMSVFSNGSRVWINGPRGLVERRANERFDWEPDRQAIEGLQRGGYFVYFRHGVTNRSEQDSDPKNLANCATQRNLTDEGRAQARVIGDAFRKLNIPVGRLLSSEYCRALEFARLSIGNPDVEPSLVLPDPLTAEERQRNTSDLLRLLASPPAAGGNTVMVSHSPNIKDAVEVDLPIEAGAVILKPVPGGKPTPVMRILPGEWTELAEGLGRP
jgi:phosphohistidine phosphatase SixA